MDSPAATMRLALVAPPTAVVPPASLGGLDQVRWLAVGLAARGHKVTLIGAGLGGLASADYAVIDADPVAGRHANPRQLRTRYAAEVGRILDDLDVEVVGDHTARGYVPAGDRRLLTAQTRYERVMARPDLSLPAHVGLVAVSTHQRRQAIIAGWLDTIHPAIPVAEHAQGRHNGPCLYIGPLTGSDVSVAIAGAHKAGHPITLVGTGPATPETEERLRPELGPEDQLLTSVTLHQRWELLAAARCLLALVRWDQAWSLEAMEAMAAGTPVVGRYGTVIGEAVELGRSGSLYLDPADLHQAIGSAVQLDPEEVRAYAERRFDLPVMVRAYERRFARLLGRT